MTNVLDSLIAARRALRDADDAALASASPASPVLVEQLEAAMTAVELAIFELNMPGQFRP